MSGSSHDYIIKTISEGNVMKRFITLILSISLILAFGIVAEAGGITKESNGASESARGYGRISIKEAYATSELIENGLKYKAENAVDGKTSTCWVEGADGYGIGENIVLVLDGVFDVSKISITGGWAINKELFDLNAKPSVLYVYFSSSPNDHYRISLDETSSTQSFMLDERNVEWVAFEIRDVYEGKKGIFDTCISEIALYGK